jgi:undecaprenyl-diphosphatase
MSFLHAIILGIVEGITEFLPVSSTGHLILVADLMRLPSGDFLKSFEVFIQLGAILAVLVLYWKKLFLNKRVFLRVALAFIPTAIVGLFLYPYIKEYLLGSTTVVLWSLAIGGVALILFELTHKEKDTNTSTLEDISYKQALVVGTFQSLAVIPGVSRAASTIVGGLLSGISRATIVEFSFLLAIPTMAAATGFDLFKSAPAFSEGEIGLLAVGFVTAFIFALIAVRFLIRFVQNHSFISFGVYRIILAGLFLLLL